MNANVRGGVASILVAAFGQFTANRWQVQLEAGLIVSWLAIAAVPFYLSLAYDDDEAAYRKDVRGAFIGYGFVLVLMVLFAPLPQEGSPTITGSWGWLVAVPGLLAMAAFGAAWKHMSLADHLSGGVLSWLKRTEHPRKVLMRKHIVWGAVSCILGATVMGMINSYARSKGLI